MHHIISFKMVKCLNPITILFVFKCRVQNAYGKGEDSGEREAA